MDESKKSLKDIYFEWLAKDYSGYRLSDLYLRYDKIDNYCKKYNILNKSFFEITDIDDLLKLKKEIERNVLNRKMSYDIVFAVELYMQYVKKHENLINAVLNNDYEIDNNKNNDYRLKEESNKNGKNNKVNNEQKVIQNEKNTTDGVSRTTNARQIDDIIVHQKYPYIYNRIIDFMEKCYKEKCTPVSIKHIIKHAGCFIKKEELENILNRMIIIKNVGNDKYDFIPENINKSDEKAETLESLLNDKSYDLLKKTLIENDITTIEKLKNANLWRFMNEHSLYTIQQRLKICRELSDKISFYGYNGNKEEKRYIIKYGDTDYCGVTPSYAFFRFISDISQKYPLKFRKIIGLINQETQKIVIRNYNFNCSKIKLINPEVYIDEDITPEEIKIYIPWIEKKCSIPAKPFEIKTNVSMPISREIEKRKSTDKNIGLTNVSVYLVTKAEEYTLKADLSGITYNTLQEYLATTAAETKNAVEASKKILLLDSKLYHEDSFVDFEEGANQLESILEKLIRKNDGIVTLNKLAEYTRSEMSMFLNDNDITEQQAVFDFARHLFEKIGYHGKRYVFKSNRYISLPEVSVGSNYDIIRRYAKKKGTTVTSDEIKKYLEGIGLNSDNIHNIMKINSEPAFLIYRENEYLSTELMHIDDDFFNRVKSALNTLFADAGDHIIIRAIRNSWYSLLPALPSYLEWTPLLLQQLIRFYSERLGARTVIALNSQDSNTLHAMLVDNNSPICDFRDAVFVYLNEEHGERIKYEAEELRRMLVESGMINGNELYSNMHKALSKDLRFIWDSDNATVTVRL